MGALGPTKQLLEGPVENPSFSSGDAPCNGVTKVLSIVSKGKALNQE